MPKVNQSIIETVVDCETGEVSKKISNQTINYGDEPTFIKLYLQDVLYLSNLPTRHSQLLYELLKRSSYATPEEGMMVYVNSELKRRIAKELGITNLGSLDNALSDLVKGKIIYRVGRGTYTFNPYLFGKGDWQNISRMRLEINYEDIRGKTFSSVCEFAKKKADAQPLRTGTEG